MKVLHVIDTIARTSGGPARSCQGLVAALCEAGVDASLMSLKPGEEAWHPGVRKYYNDISFEEAFLKEQPDLVHLHDLWRPELHRCAVICRRWGAPYVMAPRGCLEPWSLKQKWLKKRLARWLYQDGDLKGAVALHATAESEAEQFRRLGFKNPIIISPNGVNVPNGFQFPVSRSPFPSVARRALFVSRMHPKKGVMELVEAWSTLHNSTCSTCSLAAEALAKEATWLNNWKMELVYTVSGEFEKDYEAKVKARVSELGLQDQFIFTGALHDEEKWNAYTRADLFVLPTYSENFGIVVAEALWAGVPVITTKGTPWHELEERKCGWWIDVGVNPLVGALKEAISLPDLERRTMGERGHALVETKYTWPSIARSMKEWYLEIMTTITTTMIGREENV